MKSYVILDHSGSMWPCWNSAHTIAEGLFSGAAPGNMIGFIAFDNRVYPQNYFETSATPLYNKLHALGTPNGLTELSDALMVALTVDQELPDQIFVISDQGENSSEVSMPVVQNFINAMSSSHPISLFWIRPPATTTAKAPIYLRPEPPIRVPVMKNLGAKLLDLSKVALEKLPEAVNKVRLGRYDEFLVKPQ